MAHVEVYSTPYCPFCVRAKALLDQKGQAYDEIDVAKDPSRRPEMEERARSHTVPQIFIDGTHIGGCDELMQLERQGGLDPLLAK